MQARSAVQCRSARESAAVSPANNATLPMGSIVVKSVAKSLLILINRGDMGVRTPYTKTGSSASRSSRREIGVCTKGFDRNEQSGERTRLACWFSRVAKTKFVELVPVLMVHSTYAGSPYARRRA